MKKEKRVNGLEVMIRYDEYLRDLAYARTAFKRDINRENYEVERVDYKFSEFLREAGKTHNRTNLRRFCRTYHRLKEVIDLKGWSIAHNEKTNTLFWYKHEESIPFWIADEEAGRE